jgi:hypothetical protein
MDEVIGSVEWEQEWITLDRDQLVEFLRSSDLVVKDEYVGNLINLTTSCKFTSRLSKRV